ncbi:MAG TPA: hypothetical protein VGK67_02090 [Myxococcales bacterium]
MRPIRLRRPFAAAAAAVGLLLGCQCESSSLPRPTDAGRLLGIVATCSQVEGEVSVRRAGEAYWEAAQVGTTLRGGDWLRTGRGSWSQIALVRGPSVTVDEGTVVEIGLLGTGSESRPLLALESGSVRARQEASQAGSAPLAFRTPDGRLVDVAARNPGQEPALFEVSVSGGALHVVPRRGSTVVSVGGAQPQETAEGSAAELAPEGLHIEALPAFPESRSPGVDVRLPCLQGQAVALLWAPVEAARAYRVQVARDLSFQRLVVNEVVRPPSFELKPSDQAKMLAWRVASVDAKGRSSDFGFARRIFCEAPGQPDYLLGPENGAVYVAERKAAVRLSWREVEPGAGYHVAIARGPDLARDVVRAESTRERELEVSLEPGTYFWGVYLDSEGLTPLSEAPRKLKVVAGAPRLRLPDVIKSWGE